METAACLGSAAPIASPHVQLCSMTNNAEAIRQFANHMRDIAEAAARAA
jgi:hypothetical protein